ncbi:hypothetical protein BDV95DRAFT_492143 [Massariosphaeria phaeospora]|uniref:BTB domain-containing protein n=1 Tax=Massariosphaeria phaeospora TaxID=100035 RepID=A0A7C8I7Q4_9PLEO|nr:hypothetical protein BDV95DRAFT_492143 [Massariosphaeria phaeospora]
MTIVVHEIDPRADVIMVLKNQATEFAVWKTQQAAHADESSNTADGPQSTADLATNPVATEDDTTDSVEEDEVHYRVSSHHLMLASPWFERALTRKGWTESTRDKTDGLYYISAEDWDAEAFLVLMNILHLRSAKIPRTVTLDMLAKIGVIVDYYECAAVIEIWVERWLPKVKEEVTVPGVYCRDLILWIWVSWVFELPAQFKEATQVAIRESDETIRTLELPIPTMISSMIDNNRSTAMEFIINQLHALLDTYRNVDYMCDRRLTRGSDSQTAAQCASMLSGALTRNLHHFGLLSPRPEVPFVGQSYYSLVEKIMGVDTPKWARIIEYDSYMDSSVCDVHHCALGEAISRIGWNSKIDGNVQGLEWEVLH